jgi:hypothetical protein
MNTTDQRELIELWLLAGEGAADEPQLARLNALIQADEAARVCVIELARQQGWLAWNAANVELPHALAALMESASSGTATAAQPPSVAPLPLSVPARTHWHWLAMAACAIVGVLMGRYLYLTAPEDLPPDAPQLTFQATMVSSTGCIWGRGNSLGRRALGDINSSDALQLLEGLAELSIESDDGAVRLQFEGPASIVLMASGAASTSYGKIIVRTGRVRSAYRLETSFGRVLVGPRSEIGVVTFGSVAEVHCFRGVASVESPWLRSNDEQLASVGLTTAEALRFKDVGGATLQPERGAAEKSRFTPQVSMTTDFLSVPAEYVHAIVAAGPVAYWRLGHSPDGIVSNEMGEAHHGRIKGEVGWVGPEGNRAVELGLNPVHGSIVTSDSWDDVLRGDFTLELWMKPSHHHLGSMIGFVGEFDVAERRNKHGILLETNGPASPSHWLRVNQIRFLHRSTLTANHKDGVSCFTTQPYEPRRWQHVAAVRKGVRLQLYVNGELAQEAVDESATPKGLQLVIGQLYTETVERFFIGHLDEVAIYDRALQPEEIKWHFRMLRPDSRSKPSVGATSSGVL